jgi:hypothetical protein
MPAHFSKGMFLCLKFSVSLFSCVLKADELRILPVLHPSIEQLALSSKSFHTLVCCEYFAHTPLHECDV